MWMKRGGAVDMGKSDLLTHSLLPMADSSSSSTLLKRSPDDTLSMPPPPSRPKSPAPGEVNIVPAILLILAVLVLAGLYYGGIDHKSYRWGH